MAHRYSATLAAIATLVVWGTELRAQDEQTDSDRTRSPNVLEEYEPKALEELLPETNFREVTLEELLSTARQSAPAVERAKARLRKGKARVDGTDVLTKYNPVVDAGVERFPFGGFSYGEARVGVFQRFTIAGEQKAHRQSALEGRKVLEKRLARTKWAIHADIHRLYNLALVDLERLQLNYRLKTFYEDLVEIARMRLEGGESTQIAVQLSKVQLARAKQQVVRARTALVSQLRTLEERAGLEADTLPVPGEPLPEVRGGLDEDNLTQIARESYPQVEVFEALVERAKAEYDYQQKKAWPDPGVGLSFKNKSPAAGPSDNGLVARLSLPIPVWNANKLERMVSAKQRTVAQTKLATLREKLGPRIADTVQSVEAAARQIDIFGRELVPAFERELDLLRQGYEAGEFDITDVTVAQERLLGARQQALDAMDEYFEAASRVERLTGEEFWESNDNPSDK
jgi:cobalt-zinc-cadmium efflux system outer membrane protein